MPILQLFFDCGSVPAEEDTKNKFLAQIPSDRIDKWRNEVGADDLEDAFSCELKTREIFDGFSFNVVFDRDEVTGKSIQTFRGWIGIEEAKTIRDFLTAALSAQQRWNPGRQRHAPEPESP